MFCKNCGQEIAEGNAFCMSCGAPVEQQAAAQPAAQPAQQYVDPQPVAQPAQQYVDPQPIAQPVQQYAPQPAQQYAPQPATKQSGLATAAKVFMIIGTIMSAFCYLIPLAWTIPMTVSYCKKLKNNEPISTGFKVCCLIFVSTLGGIFMLCDTNK